MEILLQTLAPPSIFGISCRKSVRIWNSGKVNPAKITTFLPTSLQFLASCQRNENGKWVNARSHPFTSSAYSTPLCYFQTDLPTINENRASQTKVSYKVPFGVRPACWNLRHMWTLNALVDSSKQLSICSWNVLTTTSSYSGFAVYLVTILNNSFLTSTSPCVIWLRPSWKVSASVFCATLYNQTPVMGFP